MGEKKKGSLKIKNTSPKLSISAFHFVVYTACSIEAATVQTVILSGLWTHQPGSHRWKVTQDFSTFLLRCLPQLFSREEFSRSFLSSTVKSIFLYQRINRSPLGWAFLFLFFHPLWGKILARVTAPRFELTSKRQKVFGVTNCNHRGDRFYLVANNPLQY